MSWQRGGLVPEQAALHGKDGCAAGEQSGGGACALSPASRPRGVHVSYLGRLGGVGESQARARFLTSGTVQ